MLGRAIIYLTHKARPGNRELVSGDFRYQGCHRAFSSLAKPPRFLTFVVVSDSVEGLWR